MHGQINSFYQPLGNVRILVGMADEKVDAPFAAS